MPDCAFCFSICIVTIDRFKFCVAPSIMSLRGRLRPWQSRAGTIVFETVARGILDAPCRQLRNVKCYVFGMGQLLAFGWFCLRRVTFLRRQESHQRRRLGGGAKQCLSFFFSARYCHARHGIRPPPRPPPVAGASRYYVVVDWETER